MSRGKSIYKVLGLLALLTFVVACSEGPQIYPKINGWFKIKDHDYKNSYYRIVYPILRRN